jgi:hypothetical protein
LAEHLLNYSFGQVHALQQENNPCLAILGRWMAEKGGEATTARLLEVLNYSMQRRDVIDALKKSAATPPFVSRSESVPQRYLLLTRRSPIKQSSFEDEVFASDTTQPNLVCEESNKLSSTNDVSQSGVYPELRDDIANKGKKVLKQDSDASKTLQAQSDSKHHPTTTDSQFPVPITSSTAQLKSTGSPYPSAEDQLKELGSQLPVEVRSGNCHPALEDRLKAPDSHPPVQVTSSTVQAESTSNTSPYPTTEESLKATGKQLHGSAQGPDTGCQTRHNRISTMETQPYQEESGVVVSTTNNVKPPSKEADELDALAQIAAGGGMQSDISSPNDK